MIEHTPTIHLIGNAHLDPVWLWDWREGMTEALTTTRTILDLMDERPELTFVRGEASFYDHIERHDPETFRRIEAQVAAGRWDVVGGTWVQPDENLTSTGTLLAEFERGQEYMRSRFGRPVQVGWSPDCYGHSAGLPNILSACGIEYFAFRRPGLDYLELPLPAFYWRASGGATVLAYRLTSGWYGCERDEIQRRLDSILALQHKTGLENVACLYGLGDHGGGPTRRHLDDIREWTAMHPEVRVLHSGLHAFFRALSQESRRGGTARLPIFTGELNFRLRGTYVSHARVKRAYRQAESGLEMAERVDAAVGASLRLPPADLSEARDSVLFNAFHDIITGSSTERVMDDQAAWLGGSIHGSQRALLSSMTSLALRVDTSVAPPDGDQPATVPLLVVNAHPHAYKGYLELESLLDYRPLFAYRGRATEVPLSVRDPSGRALPFQLVTPEHRYDLEHPWRMRALVSVDLPPLGWAVYQAGLEEGSRRRRVTTSVRARGSDGIENETWRVRAREKGEGVELFQNGKRVLGGRGLSCITVADIWGSEGGMNEEHDSVFLDRVLTTWKITGVRVLESGPFRAALWVRFSGGSSRLELTFRLTHSRPAVDVDARLLWNERSARLKMVLPAGETAQFEVPGGSIWRGPLGEVPGQRWVRVRGKRGQLGFASDQLYGFDCAHGALRVSVVRATRYGTDASEGPRESPWHPVGDAGELKFRFLLCDGGEMLERLAWELDLPPLVLPVPAHTGDLPRRGTVAELTGKGLRLVRLIRSGTGVVSAWVQNTRDRPAGGSLTWMGAQHALEALPPGSIRRLDIAPSA
jgi:alpha-mannosidase